LPRNDMGKLTQRALLEALQTSRVQLP